MHKKYLFLQQDWRWYAYNETLLVYIASVFPDSSSLQFSSVHYTGRSIHRYLLSHFVLSLPPCAAPSIRYRFSAPFLRILSPQSRAPAGEVYANRGYIYHPSPGTGPSPGSGSKTVIMHFCRFLIQYPTKLAQILGIFCNRMVVSSRNYRNAHVYYYPNYLRGDHVIH